MNPAACKNCEHASKSKKFCVLDTANPVRIEELTEVPSGCSKVFEHAVSVGMGEEDEEIIWQGLSTETADIHWVMIPTKETWEDWLNNLDASRKYKHVHRGEPHTYPCLVYSKFWDNPNGAYSYKHYFLYQANVQEMVDALKVGTQIQVGLRLMEE